MEKLVSMIKQGVYFFSTPVIIGDAKCNYKRGRQNKGGAVAGRDEKAGV